MTTKHLSRNKGYPELLIGLPELPPPMAWVVHYRQFFTDHPCDIVLKEGETLRAVCIDEYEQGKFTVETWNGDAWAQHSVCASASDAQHVAAALCWMGMAT